MITVRERTLRFECACACTPFVEDNDSIPPLQPLNNNIDPLPGKIMDNEKYASLPKNDGYREETIDM